MTNVTPFVTVLVFDARVSFSFGFIFEHRSSFWYLKLFGEDKELVHCKLLLNLLLIIVHDLQAFVKVVHTLPIELMTTR